MTNGGVAISVSGIINYDSTKTSTIGPSGGPDMPARVVMVSLRSGAGGNLLVTDSRNPGYTVVIYPGSQQAIVADKNEYHRQLTLTMDAGSGTADAWIVP